MKGAYLINGVFVRYQPYAFSSARDESVSSMLGLNRHEGSIDMLMLLLISCN